MPARANSVSAVICTGFTSWGALYRHIVTPKVTMAGNVLCVYLCLLCRLGHESKGFADILRRLLYATKMVKKESHSCVKAEYAGSRAVEQGKNGLRYVSRWGTWSV